MRIVRGADAGRQSILKRERLEEQELPLGVRELIFRSFGKELSALEVVSRVVRDVRDDGDDAVKYFNQAFDGAFTPELRVSDDEIRSARSQVPAETVEALEFAARRIRTYHERQLRGGSATFTQDGLGQVVRPIEKVAVYTPGTVAVLPSSLLMTAIPARVAGVEEVYALSPAGADGHVHPLKLVAAEIAGVDAVFKAGGAQGIAAAAYGTDSIPRVDKICGPGNIFVTLAKRSVFGDVGIDALYGPTETMVIADESADPALVAADLIAQAEHDELASPILLTPSFFLAEEVQREVGRQLASLERGKIARAAFENRGGCVVVADVDEAIELANEYAPEHLCLNIDDAMAYAGKVRNAGGLFLGESSPEAVGDYTAGCSHVMPTGGSARFSSPLGVQDFLKVTSVVGIDDDRFEELGPPAAALARAEGLTGHALSIERRLQGR
jgi:histidinol dehydrogenase